MSSAASENFALAQWNPHSYTITTEFCAYDGTSCDFMAYSKELILSVLFLFVLGWALCCLGLALLILKLCCGTLGGRYPSRGLCCPTNGHRGYSRLSIVLTKALYGVVFVLCGLGCVASLSGSLLFAEHMSTAVSDALDVADELAALPDWIAEIREVFPTSSSNATAALQPVVDAVGQLTRISSSRTADLDAVEVYRTIGTIMVLTFAVLILVLGAVAACFNNRNCALTGALVSPVMVGVLLCVAAAHSAIAVAIEHTCASVDEAYPADGSPGSVRMQEVLMATLACAPAPFASAFTLVDEGTAAGTAVACGALSELCGVGEQPLTTCPNVSTCVDAVARGRGSMLVQDYIPGCNFTSTFCPFTGLCPGDEILCRPNGGAVALEQCASTCQHTTLRLQAKTAVKGSSAVDRYAIIRENIQPLRNCSLVRSAADRARDSLCRDEMIAKSLSTTVLGLVMTASLFCAVGLVLTAGSKRFLPLRKARKEKQLLHRGHEQAHLARALSVIPEKFPEARRFWQTLVKHSRDKLAVPHAEFQRLFRSEYTDRSERMTALSWLALWEELDEGDSANVHVDELFIILRETGLDMPLCVLQAREGYTKPTNSVVSGDLLHQAISSIPMKFSEAKKLWRGCVNPSFPFKVQHSVFEEHFATKFPSVAVKSAEWRLLWSGLEGEGEDVHVDDLYVLLTDYDCDVPHCVVNAIAELKDQQHRFISPIVNPFRHAPAIEDASASSIETSVSAETSDQFLSQVSTAWDNDEGKIGSE